MTRRWWVLLSLVFTVSVVAALAWRYARGPLETVAAPAHKPRYVYLPDGSTVWLNAGAEVTYRAVATLATLSVRGEAVLAVNAVRTAPLEVDLATVKLSLPGGTQVWVAATEAGLLVHCLAGTLEARRSTTERWQVAQGYSLRLPPPAGRDTLVAENVFNRLAWQHRRLAWQRAPLQAVTEDLGSYFGIPFQTDGPATDTLRFSGAFQNPSPEEVLGILARTLPVSYTRAGEGFALRYTPAGTGQ